jgi:hypothetical protein
MVGTLIAVLHPAPVLRRVAVAGAVAIAIALSAIRPLLRHGVVLDVEIALRIRSPTEFEAEQCHRTEDGPGLHVVILCGSNPLCTAPPAAAL